MHKPSFFLGFTYVFCLSLPSPYLLAEGISGFLLLELIHKHQNWVKTSLFCLAHPNSYWLSSLILVLFFTCFH